MTVAITPIDINTDTWGDALARINSLIDAVSNNAVTVGGSAANGDAVINGSITVNTANVVSVNANTISANSANLSVLTANAATMNVVTANSANVNSLHANTLTVEHFSANNIETMNANNIIAVTTNTSILNSSNAYANIASIISRLGVATSDIRYLVTFGQPGANGATTFNDRIVGISGAGGAGFKIQPTTLELHLEHSVITLFQS